MKLAQQVEKIVGQNSHLQSCFVRLEFRTAVLVPTERVPTLPDPVLDLCPSIVDLDHLAGSQSAPRK